MTTKADELLRRMLPLIVWPEKELLALCKEAVAYLNSEEGKQAEQEPFSIVQSGCIRGFQLSGKPYPRTCPACGLGPCKISRTPAPGAEKQEELNLSCKSVQKRLAYQWGFVNQEEQEPVAFAEYDPHGNLCALLRCSGAGLTKEEIEYGWKLKPLYHHPAPSAEK